MEIVTKGWTLWYWIDPTSSFGQHRCVFTVACILFSCFWWYRYQQRQNNNHHTKTQRKRLHSKGDIIHNGSTDHHSQRKTVRFRSALQRAPSSSFWRSRSTTDEHPRRLVRFYSDPDADRLDHEADVALLERTKQQQSTTTGNTSNNLHKIINNNNNNNNKIQYTTWVPPPTWQETRRNILSPLRLPELARTLTLELTTGQVATDEEGILHNCWVSPTSQPEAGVLQVGTEDHDVTEHSFRSAQAAAQFQYDVLSYQAFGEQVYHLFRVLCLVHQGSEACDFAEPVLHDACPTEATKSYVAWDDVMRCLGMYFPSLRFRLEALYALHDHKVDNVYLKESYQSKRLLLSLVDFFRLFVPELPTTALPERDCSRLRMERVLKTRKRVAKAAVLVQAYVQARTVVHRGWIDPQAQRQEHPWQRRLAYDTNWDNDQHDYAARHEYYEATVSRDIECGNCGYQGYTLVGMQSFPWNGGRVQDPVKAFPSLRMLLQRHPDRQFWIQSFYLETRGLVCVQVFVRSLATGVDRRFDTAVQRFMSGSAAYRSSQLTLDVQLGVAFDGLSMFASFLLLFLSLLLRWALQKAPQSHIAGRTALPAILLADVSDVVHYGGGKNYLACASFWGPSQRTKSFLSKILLSYLECGILSKIAVDLTVVLAKPDQRTSRRSLCSVRLVREPAVRQLSARVVWDLWLTDPLRQLLQRIHGGGDMLNRCVVAEPDVPLPDTPSRDSIDGGQLLMKIPLTQSVFVEQAVNKILEILQALEDRDDVENEMFQDFDRHDVFRFWVAENCNMRRTLTRIIATAKWRRQTFPIPTWQCRPELQNGQFFQRGFDRRGNAIFYFRTALLGPWRKRPDAVVAAVLHSFDHTLQQLSSTRASVRCVLIILLGRATTAGESNIPLLDEDPEDGDKTDEDDIVREQETFDSTVSDPCWSPPTNDKSTMESTYQVGDFLVRPELVDNPRVHPDEIYYNHTNQSKSI